MSYSKVRRSLHRLQHGRHLTRRAKVTAELVEQFNAMLKRAYSDTPWMSDRVYAEGLFYTILVPGVDEALT